MKWLINRLCLFSLLITAMAHHEAVGQSTVRLFRIEATVADVYDPDGIFPDVLPGDPVRGFLSYDLATPPYDDDPNLALYFHDADFVVAGMVIDNPRGGTAIEFSPDFGELGSLITSVAISDNLDDTLDSVAAFQAVLPPEGFMGLAPLISVALAGESGVLADASLPDSLDLADWPEAAIIFADLFDFESGLEDPASSYVIAEIHALRLVPEPATALLVSLAALVLLSHRVH